MTHPNGPPHQPTLGERYHAAALEAAVAQADAHRLERKRKHIHHVVFLSKSGTVPEKEAKTRTDDRYVQAENEWVEAEAKAVVKKAEADGLRVEFEEWRTLQATTRAKMNLR